MKISNMLIVMTAVVLMAANSEAKITSSENRGSSVRLRVLSGSVDLKGTESLPANMIETILPSAAYTTDGTGITLADQPPRSKSCPDTSGNPGGTPPSCGKV